MACGFSAIRAGLFCAVVAFTGFSSDGARAATVNFAGDLDFIALDLGGAVYSGVPLGTLFTGMIDDVTGVGSITDGTTTTLFSCCIAAGQLTVNNDVMLSADEAALANALTGTSQFNTVDIYDIIDIEGDAATGGGRIEVGLSFLFASTTFPDDDPSNYPFDPDDVLYSLFFISEFISVLGSNDVEIYSAAGSLNEVPLPAALPLFLSALGGLGLVAGFRRKLTRS